MSTTTSLSHQLDARASTHRHQQMNPPTNCRVAIVDSKPRLHGRLSDLLHQHSNARGFISLESLMARADNAPMVVVVGPTLMRRAYLDDFAHMLESRPDTAVVLACTHPTQELMEWAVSAGVADIIDLENEADKLADAVDAVAHALLGHDISEDGDASETMQIAEPMYEPEPIAAEAPYEAAAQYEYEPAMNEPVAEETSSVFEIDREAMAAGTIHHPGAEIPIIGPPPEPEERQPHVPFGLSTDSHGVSQMHSTADNGLAEVITLFSTKGGSGKSVMAANLAVKLAQNSTRPVILLDADFQSGDQTVLLRLQPEHTIADAALFLNRFDVDMLQTLLIRHEQSGVFLFASPAIPVIGDFITGEGMDCIMDVLVQFAGHVVVDTQTHMDEATLTILRRSNQILMLGSPDIPSVKDMKTSLQLMRSLDIPVDSSRVILNRANQKGDLDAKQIERSLHHRVDAVIAHEQAISISVNKRKPFVLDQPNSKFSKSMDSLVELMRKAKPLKKGQ